MGTDSVVGTTVREGDSRAPVHNMHLAAVLGGVGGGAAAVVARCPGGRAVRACRRTRQIRQVLATEILPAQSGSMLL